MQPLCSPDDRMAHLILGFSLGRDCMGSLNSALDPELWAVGARMRVPGRSPQQRAALCGATHLANSMELESAGMNARVVGDLGYGMALQVL